jgi:predicted TIM-barrel fold metal-dependent hydrolase
MIVDLHQHVLSPDRARYPFDPPTGRVAAFVEERALDLPAMRAELTAAGVARGILVQTSTAYGNDNSYAVDCAATDREHFAAVGCIDARAPDAAERLRYWVRERGMSGLRLVNPGGGAAAGSDWLDDPRTFATWAAAAELGIPVAIQLKADALPRLPALIERFPTVPVILDHAAQTPPAGAAALWTLARYPAVNLKLTTTNFRDLGPATQGFVQACVDRFGANRIAWGSNYPAQPGPLAALVALAQRELAFLPAAERAAILGGTALRLYPAPPR